MALANKHHHYYFNSSYPTTARIPFGHLPRSRRRPLDRPHRRFYQIPSPRPVRPATAIAHTRHNNPLARRDYNPIRRLANKKDSDCHRPGYFNCHIRLSGLASMGKNNSHNPHIPPSLKPSSHRSLPYLWHRRSHAHVHRHLLSLNIPLA